VTTPFHAKYWAHGLLLAHPRDGVEALSRSIGNARVDLNPHQVDAALFALRSPYSKGVLLADEVGLGKISTRRFERPARPRRPGSCSLRSSMPRNSSRPWSSDVRPSADNCSTLRTTSTRSARKLRRRDCCYRCGDEPMTNNRNGDEAKRAMLLEIERGSTAALKRARKRAEEIAARTGTALIQAVDGKPVRVKPPEPTQGR